MARDASAQDKKARSLARDRRNSYGENDKSSRTSIRARKRWTHRIARQATRQAVAHGLAAPGIADVEVADPGLRRRWRKWPDAPLGEVLYWRAMRRLERALAARLADDPAFLERLEVAVVRGGLSELTARMLMRRLRAEMTHARSAERIPADVLALLQRLLHRLA